MERARAAIIGRAAQWMLLACTLLGLATMHTLGHAGMHRPGMHETTAHSAEMQIIDRIAVGHDGGCAGDGCTQWGSRNGGSGGDMAGWNVCVAVLTGFAVLLLLALLWPRITARKTWHSAGADRAGGARSPPIRHVGLLVARVSVLRI